MRQKAAVFCHNGLGDAIVSLVISNNLHQNGWSVDTYHNGIQGLQHWFPHLPIHTYPDIDKIGDILEKYNQLIVFDNETSTFILQLIKVAKQREPEKIKVIYAYPTQGIRLKPYYKDAELDPSRPILENLKVFCEDILRLDKTTKSNGIIAPLHIQFRKHPKRVILHISSSRPGKNWSIEKYVKLALHLRQQEFEPIFVAGGGKERNAYLWLEEKKFHLPTFSSLDDLACYIYESGYLIGNDSGLGHLASCMGIPTITISRRKSVAKFWKPNWTLGKIVVPHFLIPNIRGFRLRDRKWKFFISVNKVIKAFNQLLQNEKL